MIQATYLTKADDILAVDSLTHALFIAVICALAGRPDLIPFAVLGAVIPDIDVIFQRFSGRNPRLYIFTHGGITHSVIGAGITSTAFTLLGLITIPIIFPGYGTVSPLVAIGAALMGTLTHVLLDYLAYPGIPLLYPFSDHKYTLGIMAGPSMFLTLASVSYLGFIVTGQASINNPWLYVFFFVTVILVSTVLQAYVRSKVDCMAIPGMIPVNWLIIKENSDSILVYKYNLLKGALKGVTYEKFVGSKIPGASPSPELRRMRYHSYVVVEEQNGDSIKYSDPLREHGHLWYPPYYKSVSVPVKNTSGR